MRVHRERTSGAYVDAFGLGDFTGLIALTGAGGKTSLMFRIAGESAAHGATVITTTTTNIRPPTPDQSPALILTSDDASWGGLPCRVRMLRHVTVGHARTAQRKVSGIDESALRRCAAVARIVLVEADGAAGRSIKAPESWEPVIPSFANLVIPTASLDCIGKPASPAFVFRLERFLEVACILEGDPITPQVIAKIVSNPRGGLKGAPTGAEVIPYLNKSDLCRAEIVEEVSREILQRGYPRVRRVVAGSLTSDAAPTVYS